MPVFMITLHAYRSWSEDNFAGYYQRGERGLHAPDADLAHRRSRLADQPPQRFSQHQKQLIVEQSLDIITRRSLRLHAASCTPTHAHLIASWFGKEDFFAGITEPMPQAKHLAKKIKNILATLLSKQDNTTGKRWFSRGSDCTPIDDREHLNHLLEIYLPKHRAEGGILKIFNQGNTTQQP